jgi:nicotinate-nucleotide pyrophosphorylase (carboxylating)
MPSMQLSSAIGAKLVKKEFHQCQWDDLLQADWQSLLQLAIREDLDHEGDWTTRSLVPSNAIGRAAIAARQSGVVAGLPGVKTALTAIDQNLQWSCETLDGQAIGQGSRIGIIDGPASGLLAVERLLLNFLGRMSGIATLTRKYVEAVAGTSARIFDTRKTTPGWRRLEKYAVRCGGGWNHRSGLFEAVLIKDNHLAWGASSAADSSSYTPAEAVLHAKRYITEHATETDPSTMIVEVEVDTLEQLDQVLPVGPDIVLLDNMSLAQLGEAVGRRNKINASVELEASGGVTLSTVRQIAETGIERISVGALTHSAISLDFGLDWLK